MRPAIFVHRTLPDKTVQQYVTADIVAVFRTSSGESESDYILVQYYKPALPGKAVSVLCPPEYRKDDDELAPVRHPLVPSCEYILLSDEFGIHKPDTVLGRAILVPAIQSEISPKIPLEERLASRESAFQERSVFFSLRYLRHAV